ncbi:hypothetical protein [Lactobacillus bombicola]|uniref:hypothetical protein n=1 Tax=Lactobacillus bombicola TaxID=1505723 RepID=UPI000E5906CD|nr:hypothetical protein [Lactobacillus bombicola]RHW48702.1 hypothetical protein DS833_07595 [Lactobacillus bombicola]
MADETEIKFRFTPKGQQVSAAILGGKDKIEFTKAAASIDVHINDTDTDVNNIIDLDNKKQIVDISGTVAVNNNVVQIPIKFEKNKIAEDYQMNTIGIYAKYQGQEFLYAFGALKYPLYMHHTDDSGVFKMYTYITVGTVANVVIKTDNTESVSHDELARELQKYRDELKSLDPLNSPDGNNIYDTIIDLDSYSTVGITKFLNCQLKSTGAMSGLDQAIDKLYGWIFNVPKWNGASELQQIIYICNYGQGTLTYARSRVNGKGTNVENFEKILTDKDLKAYADGVNKLVESAGKVKTVNGKNGDVTIPAFAPNLLIGTSDEWDNLPYADTIWSQQITVQQGDIISVSTILDTTKSTSAAIYIRMLNDSGGAVKDYIKGSTVTRSIGTSLLDKLVIPTGVTSIKCGIASDDNTNFASVKYKERKLAKWRDTNTPPDMTWLPNVDDTSTAINDLQNQITELKNRETYHIAADLSSGIAYSKSHPNVLVLMC